MTASVVLDYMFTVDLLLPGYCGGVVIEDGFNLQCAPMGWRQCRVGVALLACVCVCVSVCAYNGVSWYERDKGNMQV